MSYRENAEYIKGFNDGLVNACDYTMYDGLDVLCMYTRGFHDGLHDMTIKRRNEESLRRHQRDGFVTRTTGNQHETSHD